ncbi:MAG: FAD-dependent monooxygenase [Azospirillaceae bacterium]|nr:FAD-dependent monooxygenase [Azospirillaceae bacterium]
MTKNSSPAILVAGAGPTGLTLALTLRRYGVTVRLIDRAPAPATVSKALAVWSGSLEALAGLGVIDRFLAAGTRLNSLTIGSGDRKRATLAVGEGIDSPYPFPLLLPQSETEAILTARLAACGTTIERGVELVGFVADAEGVTATLRHPDGTTEETKALYLVGADGARSLVRQSLDVAFEGYTEPATYLLGDVKITGGALDHRNIVVWWKQGGTVALFPFETETWRLFAVRDAGAGESPPTLKELQDQINRHGPPGVRLHDPSWLSSFRINERLAARYRVGRVFLAGDAAHIHSPAGGQGMNTGIQDAANLGWKLAAVLNGQGNAAAMLDSYEAERRPIARDVVAGAAQKLHIAFAGGATARLFRDIAVAVIGNLPAAQRRLQIELSETEVTYRDGPLVALGTPPRRPRRTDVGTRARDAPYRAVPHNRDGTLWPLLSGPHHSLLVFEDGATPLPLGDIAGRVGNDLTLVRIAPDRQAQRRYHIRAPGWVLVRPDQVVAARGGASDLATLAKYLDHVLGASTNR